MRKIILLVLFLILGFAFLNRNQLISYAYISICDHTISYRIGSIDERFNITETELLNRTELAANVWREAAGKPLFVYDPDGLLTISMDYDGRQTLAAEIEKLEDELEAKKNSMNPVEQEYNRRAQEFKTRLAKLNEQIQYWNSRGGAPEEEYKKLVEEQKSLQDEGNKLNELARELNRSTQVYNAQIGQLNKTVGTFNSAIEVRPEEGLYSGADNTITLYFNRGQTPLVHTLAHELGHALGMDHVENPDAIMFSQTNDVIEPAEEDINELNRACKKQFVGKILQMRAAQLVQRLKQAN